MGYRIGFDVGGTKIEVALLKCSHTSFEEVFRYRVPTEREKGYVAILQKLKDLYEQARAHLPKNEELESVGLGLPGAIDPKTYVMYNGNTNAFVGHDLKKDFIEIFKGTKRVVCANDANCFALAEARYGVGLTHQNSNESAIAVGIILGTGCGGGFVVGNRFLEGKFGGAAEVGHTVLVANGRACYCGRKGCAETYVSGMGLALEYAEVSGQAVGTFSGRDVFTRAQMGEAAAQKTIQNYKFHLAEFLANMTNLLDPEYFVLGGGVSQQAEIYEGLEESVKTQRLIPVGSPRIYQNVLGDSAGVIGAALL